jgi:hypothetical protein
MIFKKNLVFGSGLEKQFRMFLAWINETLFKINHFQNTSGTKALTFQVIPNIKAL